MEKDIQNLTQNERYDLKRKQVMEEKEAYTNSSLENFTGHCFSRRLIDRLTEENQRLKAQLNKEIHYNHIMKSALEKYADLKNWRCDTITGFQSVWQGGIDDEQTGNITAQQVLKEIEKEE